MRRLLSFALLPLATSCTGWPGFEDPTFDVAPYLAVHQMRGKTRMQSASGGMVVDNAVMDLERFGVEGHEDDVGIRFGYGDGFSGLRLDYHRLDQGFSTKGVLAADWGNMAAGDQVRTVLEMDEFRLSYTGRLFGLDIPWRDKNVLFDFGIGGAVVHRKLVMRVREETALLRQEKINIEDDGLFYGTARARVSVDNTALTIDYAYSHNMRSGGDFEGTLQDLEVTASYTIDYQGITLFAGYRRSELPASGHRGPFEFDTDFILDGFMIGMSMVF